MLPCIDIGANLAHKAFRQDLTNVIYAARDAGVEAMIVTGISVQGSQDAASLCANFPRLLFSTAGIHPHNAKLVDEKSIYQLAELLNEPPVVAIGECGLDFNRNFSTPDAQTECFSAQLELAAERGVPVFMHERDAFDAFLPMVREMRDQLSNGVVHCFTGSLQQARAYLDLGLHLGITGWICDERRGLELRDIVRYIPVERMMLETDAPFLAPRDLNSRNSRNEPKHLPHILKVVAECRGDSAEALAESVLQTTRSFFDLPESHQ